MNPDDFKQAWQAQSPGRLTIDAGLLLTEVRRNQRRFTSTIFWRDVREVGVGVLLVPVWIYLGMKGHLPWTWYLCVPAIVWVVAFLVVDRMRNAPRRAGPSDPLRQCVESSLADVTHQIWLLRNVFWWYILPPAAAAFAFFGHVAWQAQVGGWEVGLFLAGPVTIAVAILAGIYWLNQHAVRRELEPRRRELAELLANLKEEPPAAGG